MKDATGELSMTAIAVVAIAAIALLFQQFVWPGIQNTIQRNTYCSQTISCECEADERLCNCVYLDKNQTEKPIKCPNNQKELTEAAGTAAAGS